MVFRTQLLLGLGAVLRCLLLLIALTTLLGLPGCRSVDNAQLDLLERELRQQESYIYELEDNLVEYSEKLRKCRCANQAHMNVVKTPERDVERIPEPELASDPALDQGDAAQVPDLADDPPPEPATPSETLETPGPTQDGTEEGQSDTIDLEQLDNLDVPDLEIGPSGASVDRRPVEVASGNTMVDEMSAVSPARYENEAEEDGTVRHASDDFDRQPTEVDSASIRSGEEGDSEQDQSRSRQAERVVIRRLLADEIPDEPNVSDGLLVVVEAINGRDEPVDVLGSVSLMVLTSGDEPQRRIRRWDFNAEEVAAAWQSSALGDGLHLQLPLGGRTLGDRPYELWARVLLGNGQKLLTKQVFRPNQLLTLAAAEKSLENETQPTIGGQLKSTIRADSTPAARISRAADHRAAGSGWQRSSLPFAQPTRSSTGGSSSGAQWTGRTPAGKTGHSGSSLPAAWQRDPPPAPSSGSQQRWTPFE